MANKHARKVPPRKAYRGKGSRYYGQGGSGVRKPTDHGAVAPDTAALVAESSQLPYLQSEPPNAPPLASGSTVAASALTGGFGTSVPARRKPWTPGRIARWVLGILGVVVLVFGGYGVFLFIKLQSVIYVPLPATPTAMAAVMPTQPTALPGQPTPTLIPSPTVDHLRDLPAGRFNVLVLGTDMRPGDTEHTPRSDTILLANIDTISHTVRIMSIPRDLIVTIPGYGENKINAAYVFGEYYHEPGGGPALAVQTVSDLFNVPVDYYVTLNFDGFRSIVDAVGGIAVDVPYSIDDDSYPDDQDGDPNGTITVHFDAGWQFMDGKTALRYARTRHADNDFARSRRQLQVIMAVRQKALSLDLLPSIPSLMDQLGGLVQTNIPFDQQLGLAQLGFNMSASDIITSSIDDTMISPDYLPDGGEGLKLNEKLAQPTIDSFFGWDNGTPTPTPTVRATATPPSRTPTPTRVVTP
ncbi:MAG TPA: LCP family protein [Chloroflexia bacterium]|nr:LCP family protein [Chloroflexia bacterium]